MMTEIKNKRVGKLSELSYVFGIVLISLGVALLTKADFGVSAVVAPAYAIHRKMVLIGQTWCTFGTAEYIFQGAVLALMCIIVRRFRWKYLLSFLTSVIYGMMLDGWLLLLGTEKCTDLTLRIVFLVAGILVSSAAIAFLFRTYLPQQVYELFVKEIVERYRLNLPKFKLIFDISMLVLAVVILLALNVPLLDGIGIGTVVCAVFNSLLIGLFGKLYDRFFCFDAAAPRIEKLLK